MEGYVPGSKNIGMKVRHLHVFDQYYQMVIGEGNGNPLQYFCQGNPMDGGALWATVHGVTRVRHNLAIKSPPPPNGYIKFTITDIATKVCLVKAMVFPVVMYGCESWTVKKAEC